MDLNLQNISTELLVFLVGGAITWLFTTVLQLRRDMDAAFTKIRAHSKHLGIESDKKDQD